MQERVVDQGEAERAEPSWYLTRDGKQYGPLTDRELSLFAEGGNFKKGDLLWTAGLDSWKPADAIFGVASSPEADADEAAGTNAKVTDALVFIPSSEANGAEAVEANGEVADAPVFARMPAPQADAELSYESNGEAADAVFHLAPEPDDTAHATPEPHDEAVDALVQTLNASGATSKPTLKERAIAEAKKFAGIFLYLWVVFTVLLLTEWIALAEHNIGFKFYGLAAINALVLAKIMLVADNTRFANRLKGMPLVYPIIYKAVAFTTLLFAAYVVEEMLIGVITGHGLVASVPDIGGGLMGALALWLIFCVALVPYFAFREIEQAVGAETFRRLLLGSLPTRR